MLRVLLIERDEDIRLVLTELLVGSGFNVTSVASGPAAVNWLNLADFDILITDTMANCPLTGIALAKIARQRSETLPVVFISASSSELAHAADFHPPHACVQKPFRIAEMLVAIANLRILQIAVDRRPTLRR